MKWSPNITGYSFPSPPYKTPETTIRLTSMASALLKPLKGLLTTAVIHWKKSRKKKGLISWVLSSGVAFGGWMGPLDSHDGTWFEMILFYMIVITSRFGRLLSCFVHVETNWDMSTKFPLLFRSKIIGRKWKTCPRHPFWVKVNHSHPPTSKPTCVFFGSSFEALNSLPAACDCLEESPTSWPTCFGWCAKTESWQAVPLGNMSSSWWFQPICKKIVNMGIFPK